MEARKIADLRVTNAPLKKVAVAQVRELSIPGPAGPLMLRFYRPTDAPTHPVCLFFHGGGFMFGNLDTHDSLCRALAARSGVAMVAVDFRLSPEHRFPAAHEDCLAATRWVLEHAEEVGVDAERFAVAGESSGGNLAAGVALRLRAFNLTPALQLLLYPLVDMEPGGPSYEQFAHGFLLTAKRTQYYINSYLRSAQDKQDPSASPLRDPTPALTPPTFLLTAGLDLSWSSAHDYGVRLGAANVPVERAHFEGWPHGFLFWGHPEGSLKAIETAAGALRRACSLRPDPRNLTV
jgi:acetyl esterase